MTLGQCCLQSGRYGHTVLRYICCFGRFLVVLVLAPSLLLGRINFGCCASDFDFFPRCSFRRGGGSSFRLAGMAVDINKLAVVVIVTPEVRMPVTHRMSPLRHPREAVDVEVPLKGLNFGSLKVVAGKDIFYKCLLIVDEERKPIAGPSDHVGGLPCLLTNHRHEPLRKRHRSAERCRCNLREVVVVVFAYTFS